MRTTRASWLLLMAMTAMTALPLHAAPELPANAPDPLLQLLQDKGLLPTAVQLRQAKERSSDLLLSAMSFLGVAYRPGGNSSEAGFDCSGFTRVVFENSLGLVLPRRAEQQAQSSALQAVKADELAPGDLVFFNTLRRAFSHVGIYMGEGKFIHAPRSGAEVRIEDMRLPYWSQRFDGARRALAMALPLPVPSPSPAAESPAP
jgi:cell wall-associated NlpC family hydrolase